MTRVLLVAICLLGLAGAVLAQTTSTSSQNSASTPTTSSAASNSTTTSTTSTSTLPTVPPYTGLEGFLYNTMPQQQQDLFNSIKTYQNLSTQIVNAAFYQFVAKKFDQGDTLNPYEQAALAAGPTGVSSTTSSTTSTSTSASGS